MTGVSVVTAVHLLATVVAVVATAVLLLLPPRVRALLPHLGWAGVGTVVWTLCVASVKHEGIHPWHQAPWFPAIAFTTGAVLMWAGWFAEHDWRPGRALTATWLAAPALILAVRLVGGTDVRFVLFVVNTVYCFTLLLAIAVRVARRANDRERGPRWLARFILVAAVVTLIAEAFRLNVTDLFMTVTLVVIVATAVRAGDDLHARPEAGTLIDDLGALVLLFDAQQRLVEVNAPTRLFYAMRGAVPPEPGTHAGELLGADLGELDTVTVSLVVGSDHVRLSGYVQRLPSDGAPPGGWVCLLRRSTPVGSDAAPGWTRRALMGRVPSHDPATGLLSPRAFQQALAEAAQHPDAQEATAVALLVDAGDPARLADTATALASWEPRPEAVATGRYDQSSVALVVKDVAEPAVQAWLDETGLGDRHLVATRTGSVAEVAELLEAAASDLSRRARP